MTVAIEHCVRTGCTRTVDHRDLTVFAADLTPICGTAREVVANLLARKRRDACTRINDDPKSNNANLVILEAAVTRRDDVGVADIDRL